MNLKGKTIHNRSRLLIMMTLFNYNACWQVIFFTSVLTLTGCGPTTFKIERAKPVVDTQENTEPAVETKEASKPKGDVKKSSKHSIAVLEFGDLSWIDSIGHVLGKVDRLTVNDLLTEQIAHECLMLLNARRLPAKLFDPIQRYMAAGGDVIFLGGKPWSEATYQLEGEWLTGAVAKDKLQSVPFTPVGGDEDVQNYRRVAFTQETETAIKKNQGSQGSGVMLVLDARDWYDYYVRELRPEEVPQGTTMFSLMVKGHCHGRGAYLEVTERDGSVWWRKIPVAKEWALVVNMASDFQYLKGNDARQGTALDLGNIQSFGIGQEFKHAGMKDDKYWIWMDELAMSNALKPGDFPWGDLGGNFRILSLYPYADYDVFDVNNVHHVKRFEKSPFETPVMIDTQYSGVSAVGLPAPEDGFFIPLLEAYGPYEDSLGWAGGAVINTAGAYQDSNWAFFNMPDMQVYADPAFATLLSEVLSHFKDGTVQTMKPKFELSDIKQRKSKQIGFVQPSESGQTLVDAQGNDFFLIGSNYIYPMNSRSFGFWSKKEFSQEDLLRIEDDFRKMQAAGINTIRVFNQDPMNEIPEMNAKFKELCRTYGIQMLMQIVTHSYDETDTLVMERLERVVNAFKGDPAVFGYDVQNEPQIGEIGGVRIKGKPSALLKLRPSERYQDQIDTGTVEKQTQSHKKGQGGYPKIAPWLEDKQEVRDLYSSESIWRGQIDKVYSPKDRTLLQNYPSSLQDVDASLFPFLDALDKTFNDWYAPQAKRIRELAPEQILTVGYNRGYVALPFNEDLDFLSQHSYFQAKNDEEVMLYTKIQDKLREIWPDKPVTIGEFGYSSGVVYGDEYLSVDSSATAELLMYLHGYAKGYSGAMKWRLNDDELPSTFKDYHWQKDFPERRRLYEARFGMYVFDGYQSLAKPIVHCLSFFRDYVDQYATDRGSIETATNPKVPQINTQYVYRANNALFIGNVESQEGLLTFKTPDGQVANLMAMWNDSNTQLMSTKTMEVTLHKADLAKALSSGQLDIAGTTGPVNADQKKIKIVLIKGQPVTLSQK